MNIDINKRDALRIVYALESVRKECSHPMCPECGAAGELMDKVKRGTKS